MLVVGCWLFDVPVAASPRHVNFTLALSNRGVKLLGPFRNPGYWWNQHDRDGTDHLEVACRTGRSREGHGHGQSQA
jgi:hypothetical protein